MATAPGRPRHRATTVPFVVVVSLAVVALVGGCAGHSFSAPDGPISFEFSCKGWSAVWSRQTSPYRGVLVQSSNADAYTGDPSVAYTKCAGLGPRRGLVPRPPTRTWARASFTTKGATPRFHAPAGDPLTVEVGPVAAAGRWPVSSPGQVLAIEVYEG